MVQVFWRFEFNPGFDRIKVLRIREQLSREYVDIRFSFMKESQQIKIVISSRASGSSSSKRSELGHPNILERGPLEIYRHSVVVVVMSQDTVLKLEDELEVIWRKKKMANVEQENYTRRVLWRRVDEGIV
ncbi:hypothetical protein FRB91_002726 [Serendipita sp. 411]|nr:hypothetical protein FRB91_002726 [Serendipita sp. 411]